MGKRNGKYNRNGKCKYRDIAIRCPGSYVNRAREIVDSYEGISSGKANRVTGTKDWYVPVRIFNGTGSSNWPSLRRDLRTKIGIEAII